MPTARKIDYTIRYRPDIDGIRAIAVVSVVLYHFFPTMVPGGFIGVDVFFVISGYLISSIILSKNKKQTFSILDFYSRRIKRIFPALAVVLITCLVFGWFALLTNEYRQLGKHIAGSTLFVQNLVLLSEANYFDNTSITKPLLHLWSLGIEEQFYLLWPVVICLCTKHRKNLIATIAIIGGASFLIGLWYLNKDFTSAAYYSPDSRAWELLAGAALAWLHSRTRSTHQVTFSNNLVASAGLLLLVLGLFLIDKDKTFPGTWALLPVIATTMLIFAQSGNVIARTVLSSRLMVFIGLISYPLYLWHWPLISFAWIINGSEPALNVKIVLMAATFLLAWLTFTVIERPFRKSTYAPRSIFNLAALLTVIGIIGSIVYFQQGFPQRENAELKGYSGDIGHDEFHKYIATHFFLCTPDNIAKTALKWNTYTRCMQSKKGNVIDIVLLGDSHAEHLFIGMAEALPMKNVAFYIEDGSPFPGNPKFSRLYETIVRNPHIKIVVLTMYWHGRFGETPAGSTLEDQITATTKLFTAAGKKVILTDDVADFPFTPDKCKGLRWLSFGNRACEIPRTEADQEKEKYLPILQNIADKDENVELLAEGKYLCDTNGCSMIKDGKLMYRDTHHLNINGSRYIGEKIVTDNPQAFQ
ncbi:acyltransferase family protein [Kosakonia sp. LAM2021]|uniref:acyltransferase family protein n=1 Tax=Kosakonia sp. LAM2021 TaxID=2800475 RepID=UPI00190C7203|nr:acyltransferase family protein [Kosakonia sp. LAM2021]